MKLAVLCPSEIAFRRFMPALQQVEGIEYIGVGVATAQERCEGVEGALPELQADAVRDQEEFAGRFFEQYGGAVYASYQDVLTDSSIDAIYIPLPPGLHYIWANRALGQGKHVLLEKPFTSELSSTQLLISLSREKDLAVHENYMFAFHSQIDYVRGILAERKLGEVRLVRIDFGFPFRGSNDFRYSKSLGGGALLDCGGYTIKLASLLLGSSATVSTSRLNFGRGLEVDLYGSATLENDEGLVVQVSFGMDNDYRCDIDVWGSEATLHSGRILTAPNGYEPTMILRSNGEEVLTTLPADDSFKKSLDHFVACVENDTIREENRVSILRQASLVQDIVKGNQRSC